MQNLSFLIFVAVTFCCWGVYGPTLHVGQEGLGAGGKLSLLRPLICVGISYFLIAVLYPTVALLVRGEKGGWTLSGFLWSFIAGAVGAFGALGIVLAFKYEGKPIYVMPLVFGLAPIVNTLVTMTMAKTLKQANFLFLLGILTVAVGAAGVLLNKPAAKKTVIPVTIEKIAEVTAEPSTEDPLPPTAVVTDSPDSGNQGGSFSQLLMVILGIAITAFCWGSYGAVLHKGQAKMDGSRLRPFLCVGLAYFVIAVVAPFLMMPYFPEPGGWLNSAGWLNRGVWWSLAAGAAGAFGALGIIYAFNFGGKPVFVMPLVFGFAPVVNTLVETTSKGLLSEIKPMFYPSLGLVIAGAVMVLVFAPKGPPPAGGKPATSKPPAHPAT
jgi:hypothetical protein